MTPSELVTGFAANVPSTLLSVSGIVHATPSFETVTAEIGVRSVRRVLSRSPFASAHGTAAAAGRD